METTKVTRLSPLNVRALRESCADLLTADGSTTATFYGDAFAAAAALRLRIEKLGREHGRKRHPVASLHAVQRKLDEQATLESPLSMAKVSTPAAVAPRVARVFSAVIRERALELLKVYGFDELNTRRVLPYVAQAFRAGVDLTQAVRDVAAATPSGLEGVEVQS